MCTRFGAFLAGAARFDAGAFRVPRNEAANLDPQQRLLLEEVGAALAGAGNAAGQPVGSFTGTAVCLCATSMLANAGPGSLMGNSIILVADISIPLLQCHMWGCLF